MVLKSGSGGPVLVDPHTVLTVPAADAPVLPGSPDQLQDTKRLASVKTSAGLRLVTSKSCQS